MRLTLRTMLAYMDGILESEDAEDIRKKIDESEFATNLLHRTRDVMRRLRLTAPSVSDRGPGLDANTVAEYLDNTLHDGRVPDFEKVCLDSDVHLAEVASCHQILTLVLGEAAEIDPDARQRMYQLPDLRSGLAGSPGDATATEAASGDGESNDEPSTPKSRRKPTIPDYLREPRKKRRFLPAAAALVLTAAVIVLVLASLGQFDRESWLMCLLLDQPEIEGGPEPDQEAPASEQPVTEPQPPQEPALDKPTESTEKGGPLPVAPMPPEPSNPPTPPTTSGESETADGSQDESQDERQDESQDERQDESPPDPQRMGRLVSDAQVLLRYNSETSSWQRVPSQGILVSAEPLLSLPAYRPKITLGAGVTLQLVDSTRIELLPSDEQQMVGVKVSYGRAFVMPLAEAGTQLRLVVGDRTGVITFPDAESTAALEVTPVRVPGTDPETEPSSLVASLYAKSGNIFWGEGAGQASVGVEADTCLVIDSQSPPVPVAAEEFPKWVTTDTTSDLDQRASSKLEQTLQTDREPSLVLAELADPDYRQVEVRRLAARCLGDMGRFDSMVAALDHFDRRLDWPEYYIEYLRSAVTRGPQSARRVREAIERQFRQDEPAALYRMLWGYGAEDLESGEDGRLVEHLEHKLLAFRVVSFWNLKQITGYGLSYHPEDPANKRQAAVENWKERREAGEIRIGPSAEEPAEPPGGEVQSPEEVQSQP